MIANRKLMLALAGFLDANRQDTPGVIASHTGKHMSCTTPVESAHSRGHGGVTFASKIGLLIIVQALTGQGLIASWHCEGYPWSYDHEYPS